MDRAGTMHDFPFNSNECVNYIIAPLGAVPHDCPAVVDRIDKVQGDAGHWPQPKGIEHASFVLKTRANSRRFTIVGLVDAWRIRAQDG